MDDKVGGSIGKKVAEMEASMVNIHLESLVN